MSLSLTVIQLPSCERPLPALTPCPPPPFRADSWPPLLKRLLGVPQRVRWVPPATGAGYRRQKRFTGAQAVVWPPALRRHSPARDELLRYPTSHLLHRL